MTRGIGVKLLKLSDTEDMGDVSRDGPVLYVT